MFNLFPRPPGFHKSLGKQRQGFGVSLGAHAALGALVVFGLDQSGALDELAKPIAVSLMQAPAEKQAVQPAPPQPKQPKLKQAQPVATQVATAPSAAPAGVMAQTAPTQPAVESQGSTTEARFDANYLNNPKPPYPMVSRRLGESGTVYLRVQVSAQGDAQQVEIKKSSGFARLDQCAQETVSRWRFVPARRGDAPVGSWVVVPIVFSLT